MMIWHLAALIHSILCSQDMLYTLRAQDALRRFHHYGLNNIYGIRTLHRRQVASFPIIHTLDTLDSNGTLIAQDPVSTEFTVNPDIPEGTSLEHFANTKAFVGSRKVPDKSATSMIPMEKRISVVDRFTSVGAHNGVSIQLIEIRKVKRIGGGYPYGPKNFTISEFTPPLRVEKSIYGFEEIVFRTNNYNNSNKSTTDDSENIWAVQRLDPPSVLCNATLSCRYCLSYWKIQKKFKPFNVYIFCCK